MILTMNLSVRQRWHCRLRCRLLGHQLVGTTITWTQKTPDEMAWRACMKIGPKACRRCGALSEPATIDPLGGAHYVDDVKLSS